MPPKDKRECIVCNKEAQFQCGGCQSVAYCDPEHQKQHWVQRHQRQCRALNSQQTRQDTAVLIELRMAKREKYYNFFSAQKYEECLLIVKEMQLVEIRIANISKDYFDEFQHAATVCLHIKTLQLLNEKLLARVKLQSFLKTNRIISDVRSLPVKGNLDENSKTFLTNKLNLIASVANLSYALGLSPVELYTVYTQNVQLVFGNESLEASNCFFMIGHFYYDEGQKVKAIACFKRASQMRYQESFECYINMGVCYKDLKRNSKAIEMFTKGLQKLAQQNNQYSNQAAELNEYLAITYLEDLDFQEGIKHLQVAYMIRNKDPYSHKCKELNQMIVFLHDHLDKYIDEGVLEAEKPQIFKYLKQNVLALKDEITQKQIPSPSRKEARKEARKESEFRERVQGDQKDEVELESPEGAPKKQIQTQTELATRHSFKMNLPTRMLESLDPEQLCALAKLQLELENCNTYYRVISAYNKSKFISSLTEAQKKDFKNENLDIFKDMNIVNTKEEEVDFKKSKPKVTVAPLDFTTLQRNI